MSNAAKLKKKAVELEQKKQLDKALALYIQFLQESDGSLDDIDIPLYNRVGDILIRTGNASDALNYYEKAVDLYADRGFHNNAIALCNKVLRQSPGRASIYYKLGKISATKGFKNDAKKNFLEYADRMQKAGQINEAFRALKEFADLCPDQDDIRLMLAEQLTKENRQDEALEQLQKLHDRLDSEGRTAEVRATVDRMKSIDPDAVPRVSGSYRPQKSTDLIFLDTSFEQKSSRSRDRTPAAPPPAGRQVSDPDLVVLTLADQPDATVSPAQNAAVSGAFGLVLDTPNDSSATDALPLLDVGEELPSADLVASVETVTPQETAPQPASVTPLDLHVAGETAAPPPAGDLVELDLSEPSPAASHTVAASPEPAYVSGPPLSIDYASDLAADFTAPVEADGGDLFDFRAPPRSDGSFTPEAVPINLDPDVAFPSFDVDDISLPSADEVTSGGSLAAALGAEAGLGMELEEIDVAPPATPASREDAIAIERDTPATEQAERLDVEWTTAETAAPTTAPGEADASQLASIDDMIVDEASGEVIAVTALEPARDTPAAANADVVEVSVDDLLEEPPTTPSVTSRDDVDRWTARAQRSGETETVSPTPTPEEAAAEPPAYEETVSERLAGWELQRTQAERLLETGDRAGGVHILEQVAAELERIGDLERALTIVDELIRLSPDSIRHHQKRVELAFRANDRAKLIDAYLELGDVLFRSGEERKARAVYQRVLELAPDDPRARAAFDSVSSMSPPAGSGAIQTIPGPVAPPADVRRSAEVARPPADSHAGQATAGNGVRAAGIGAPPQSRKPSPLDRSAAANGEFVDLGQWLRSGENPKSTRMVAEEKPPSGDEQADFQEMLKRFKQGVAENVDDEDYESHYDLGVAYKEMGLMDEAVAEFQKALRGQAKRVRSYEALGQCFVEKEQYQVAASVLGRAIALGEGDDHHLVGVLYLLGRATEALSKTRDALDYYQRVFAVDIAFRDVADRISAIERKAT
jgi:tetratricopeptide (TPR) repeat protein